MMKRALVLFLFTMIALTALPVLADAAFSGVVIDATPYSVMVKNGDDMKLFQIGPETKGDREPSPQDLVTVIYQDNNGTLVALDIKITKHSLNSQ